MNSLEPISGLNMITNNCIGKIHETTDHLVNRITQAQAKKPKVKTANGNLSSPRAHQTSYPHMFSKNLLTREQLDELLQMSNLKRGIFSPTKRRSMQHEPAKTSRHHNKAAANKRHHSNIRSHREKRAIIC